MKRSEQTSRRRFLKRAGVGVVALGTVSMADLINPMPAFAGVHCNGVGTTSHCGNADTGTFFSITGKGGSPWFCDRVPLAGASGGVGAVCSVTAASNDSATVGVCVHRAPGRKDELTSCAAGACKQRPAGAPAGKRCYGYNVF